MLLEEEIQQIIYELTAAESTIIHLGGSVIDIKILEHSTKICFSTSVYFGGNYIPKSVRVSLKHTPPFQTKSISSAFKINEENFEIFLIHEDRAQGLTKQGLILLLEDFSWLAERWREHLDENDKKDLVYIHSS